MKISDALESMRSLPLCDLDGIVGDYGVLILAPHPDDESLGCGGLIAECCARHRPPFVLILTDGAGSHPSSQKFSAGHLRAIREAEARAAVAALGLDDDRIGFLRLPDTAAPHEGKKFEEAVAAIVRVAERWGCRAIASPWRHDPHGDHLACHRMAQAAAARLGLRQIAYPIWGWTLPPDEEINDDVDGARLDISAHLQAKRRAIAAHASQHGKVVTDDPNGFSLPEKLLEVFERPYEVFLFPR
jgi:LmbE family N-acetylglucosaminyl deacetylase